MAKRSARFFASEYVRRFDKKPLSERPLSEGPLSEGPLSVLGTTVTIN